MNHLRKILRSSKQRIKQLISKPIQYLPISSKYLGPPKSYYASCEEYFKFCQRNNISDVAYTSFLPPSVSYRNPPKSTTETIHWKFDGRYVHQNPETFVISIPNGRAYGSGAIITNNDRLLLDVSFQFGIGRDVNKVKSHPVFNSLKLPKCQEMSKTLAVLATSGGETYFHWLTDALPRLEILRSTLSDKTEPIDKYIVNKGIPVIEESMKMLGISPDKLIFIDSSQHIEAKYLVVPSLPGLTGDPPVWVCSFLREKFLKYKANIPPISKLYISRSKATWRRVTNEENVIECLAKFGFTPVWLEEHDFATQIALFSNAELIVAPHGAGLTNLMWCNSGAKVIEIFSPNYVNVCFWAIANQIGMEYYYLIGNGARPTDYFDPHLAGDDINIPVEELIQILRMLLK